MERKDSKLTVRLWQTIKTLNIEGDKTVNIGKWSNDHRIYFSIEGLKPEDFVDSDTWEFPIYIAELEQIIRDGE